MEFIKKFARYARAFAQQLLDLSLKSGAILLAMVLISSALDWLASHLGIVGALCAAFFSLMVGCAAVFALDDVRRGGPQG